MNVADAVPVEGLLRASWHTVESLLYMRPLFDVRCVVASPEPLSPSMLSALGHAYSEPPIHGTTEPVLRGGFAVLRGDHEVDRDIDGTFEHEVEFGIDGIRGHFCFSVALSCLR